jgi:hypothetical protein
VTLAYGVRQTRPRVEVLVPFPSHPLTHRSIVLVKRFSRCAKTSLDATCTTPCPPSAAPGIPASTILNKVPSPLQPRAGSCIKAWPNPVRSFGKAGPLGAPVFARTSACSVLSTRPSHLLLRHPHPAGSSAPKKGDNKLSLWIFLRQVLALPDCPAGHLTERKRSSPFFPFPLRSGRFLPIVQPIPGPVRFGTLPKTNNLPPGARRISFDWIQRDRGIFESCKRTAAYWPQATNPTIQSSRVLADDPVFPSPRKPAAIFAFLRHRSQDSAAIHQCCTRTFIRLLCDCTDRIFAPLAATAIF